MVETYAFMGLLVFLVLIVLIKTAVVVPNQLA